MRRLKQDEEVEEDEADCPLAQRVCCTIKMFTIHFLLLQGFFFHGQSVFKPLSALFP